MSGTTVAQAARPAPREGSMTSPGLVRSGPVALDGSPDPITDPRTFAARLEQLCQSYNVLSPPVQMLGGFAPGWTLTASLVRINTTINDDGQGPETYHDRGFMKSGDQRALNRVGLLKIATAAGIKWTPNTGRRDDGSERYLWQYFAEGLVDTPDGSYQIISGEVEIDLRDGSPQVGGWTPDAWAALMQTNQKLPKDQRKFAINGWSDRRLQQARAMGLRLAESKAKNRAIRSLGLQQVYSVQELAKPFVVFKASYVPDMSDPVVRQMVAQRALHGRQVLYPSLRAVEATPLVPTPLPPAGTLDTTLGPAVEATAALPEPVVGLTVLGVTQVVHEGRPRDLWDITFSDDRTARTKDAEVARAAQQARDQAWLVDPMIEPSAQRRGAFVLTELTRVASTSGSSSADDDLY